MRKIFLLLISLLLISIPTVFAGSFTDNHDLFKPSASGTGWGGEGIGSVNQNFNILDYLVNWHDAQEYTSINDAITEIGSTPTTLVVSNAQTLAANITFPSTLHLVVVKGGSIVKASTYVPIINGPFDAGFYLTFSGFNAGDVTFGAGAVKEIYPEWWGENTTPGTTDMIEEITAAIGSFTDGMIVALQSNIYKVSSAINITKTMHLKGSAMSYQAGDNTTGGTRIINSGTGDAIYIHVAGDEAFHVLIENMRIEGNAGSRYGINIYTSMHTILRNVFIGHPTLTASGHGSHGLYIQGDSYYNNFYDVTSYKNGGDGVYIAGTLTDQVNENTFYSLKSSENIGNGFTAVYTNALKLFSGSFEGNDGKGFTSTYSSEIVLNGTRFEGNTGYGIDIGVDTIHFTARDLIYGGNGNSNVVYVNPGLHASGAGGYLFSGGDYPSGGINIGTAKYVSVRDTNISTLTISANAKYVWISGIPLYTTITNSAPWNADVRFSDMGSTQKILTENSVTPSVKAHDFFRTANSAATIITMFSDGYAGQTIKVLILDANTTIDFTGTNLKGNAGIDWSPATTDWMECIFDGTDWYCSCHDTTS